jgi:hypothetical protein
LEMLGSRDVISELFGFLTAPWVWSCSELVVTIGNLGGSSTAPRLLAALLDKEVYPVSKLQLAVVLRDLKEPAVVGPALDALQDSRQPWELRWHLTEVLEGYQETARNTLMQMLGASQLDERVKVGIAATLGKWKQVESIPYLRAAIQNEVLPLDFQVSSGSRSTYTLPAYYWSRVAAVLRSLDDNSIVPFLADRVESTLRLGQPDHGTIYVLAENWPEAAGQIFLGYLDREHSHLPAEIWSIIPHVLSKPLVPQVVRLLEDLLHTTQNQRILLRDLWPTLDTIGEVADDAKTAGSLLRIVLALDNHNEFLPLEPLLRVCQRARVRAYPDGRVLPIGKQA